MILRLDWDAQEPVHHPVPLSTVYTVGQDALYNPPSGPWQYDDYYLITPSYHLLHGRFAAKIPARSHLVEV